MSALPVLRAEALHKTYATDGDVVEAVAGVDLAIGGGELLAIMGPSGCGKSTLLHLLGGLAKPSAGRVLLDGVDLSGLSDRELAEVRRTKVGFVFQAFNLVPVLSAVENVALPAAIAGRPSEAATRRASELLGSVGLGDRRERRPAELSGGEQQRVAIARALMMEPGVVLADEPTGNLDSRMGREIAALLIELNRSGQTIVIVTHDVKVAGVAQRLVVMRDGHTQERVPSSEASAVGAVDALERLLELDDPADLPW